MRPLFTPFKLISTPHTAHLAGSYTETTSAGVALKLDLPFELAAEEQTTFQDIKAALGGRDAGVGFLEYKKAC